MSPIRPLERADLGAVCRLYERVARSGSSEPPPQLASYFERTVLDHPWADPDIPSLVYEDREAGIVGFILSNVRRLRLHRRPVRMACSSHLVADPRAAHRGVGALLLRKYLAGPQDLTITDGATPEVGGMWETLGGWTLAHSSLQWLRVFRPSATGAWGLARHRPHSRLARSLPRVCSPLDAVLREIGGRLLRASKTTGTVEPLTAEALVALMPEVERAYALYPGYDAAFLDWLFREVAAVETRGTLVRNLVRAPDGRVAGWYVYYLAPHRVAQTLQVATLNGDPGFVLDHLFEHAERGGAIALGGRLEPALLRPLSERRCLIRPSELALVHSRDPEVLAAVGCGGALLTRLDGEWWMGHHVLWR